MAIDGIRFTVSVELPWWSRWTAEALLLGAVGLVKLAVWTAQLGLRVRRK